MVERHVKDFEAEHRPFQLSQHYEHILSDKAVELIERLKIYRSEILMRKKFSFCLCRKNIGTF